MVGILIFFWGGNSIEVFTGIHLSLSFQAISGCSEEFPRLFCSLDTTTLPTVPTMGISEPSRDNQAGEKRRPCVTDLVNPEVLGLRFCSGV